MAKVLIGNLKGPKGDKGDPGDVDNALLTLHVEATEPHPAYDNDIPSLALIFENGLP